MENTIIHNNNNNNDLMGNIDHISSSIMNSKIDTVNNNKVTASNRWTTTIVERTRPRCRRA